MPHSITTNGLSNGIYRAKGDNDLDSLESGTWFSQTPSILDAIPENGLDRNRTGSGFVRTSKTTNSIQRNGIGGSFKEPRTDLNANLTGFNRRGSSNSLNRSRPGSGRVSPIGTVPPSPTGSEVRMIPSRLSQRSISIHVEDPVEYVTCCHPETSVCRVIVKLTACVLAGIVFGWCMEKSRVFEPASIRLQMVFRRWIMLKMFLAAVASGQLIMALLSLVPKFKERFHESLEAFGGCLAEKKGLLTSVLGPFMLGSGMTLSGACPGMVLPQVGAWAKNSIFTLIGCLAGALLYGLVAPYVVSITKPRKPFKTHTVHTKFGLHFAAVALPMAGVILLTVVLMEVFIPWTDDLEIYNRNDFDLDSQNLTEFTGNIFTAKSWPPSVSGTIIGLLQVVIIFTVTDTLGGSSSYATVVSQWVVTDRLRELFPYMANSRTGIGNWWQVFYVCGAVLGGLFSALASASVATTKGGSIATSLCGGMLMLLGARLGAGCTSGHGLSGMGLLFWLSMLAVPAMFGGGIVTAFAMDATDALNDWTCHPDYDWMCDGS